MLFCLKTCSQLTSCLAFSWSGRVFSFCLNLLKLSTNEFNHHTNIPKKTLPGAHFGPFVFQLLPCVWNKCLHFWPRWLRLNYFPFFFVFLLTYMRWFCLHHSGMMLQFFSQIMFLRPLNIFFLISASLSFFPSSNESLTLLEWPHVIMLKGIWHQ